MDSSEHIDAEKELKKEKKFLQNILATIPDSLLVLNKHLRIKSANRSFYELFQAEPEKIMGSKIADVLGDKDGKLSAKLAQLFGTEDMLWNFELYHQSEKLGERMLNLTARGVIVAEEEEEEEEEEELVVIQDITERKQAEKSLRDSEEKYRTLVNNISLGIFRSTPEPDGKFLEVNPAMEWITGYSRKELLQMNISDLYWHPEERKRILEEISSARGLTTRELNLRKKDRTEITVFDTKVAVRNDAGQIKYFDGILQDITERKQAEEALRMSEENFRRSMDDSPMGIRIVDADGNTIYANRAILDLYGYDSLEELNRTSTKQRYTPESYVEHRMRVEKRQRGEYVSPNYEISIVRKNGEIRHLEVFRKEVLWNGKTEFQVLYRDVTDLKKMQEQLIMQDRLASIGQLTSGVAHELNNPLTSVIGFSELLMRADVPDAIKKDLETINREAHRTATIVRNLLTFARGHREEKQQVDINKAIQSVLELRAYEQKVNNIQVVTQFAVDLPQIIGNSSQLQQVFFNIVINAEFFMLEAHGRGTLTITTEKVGNSVRASFTDDGPGIPKENLEHRLFNPFFTTKPVGKGTGLGLSICHGIITAHDGRIYAESELGKGATFIVELPISQQ